MEEKKKKLPEHGTYARAQQHIKTEGVLRCLPCTDARNEYMREYRKKNPHKLRADRRRSDARQRALRRLGQRYPEELQQLIQEELNPFGEQ